MKIQSPIITFILLATLIISPTTAAVAFYYQHHLHHQQPYHYQNPQQTTSPQTLRGWRDGDREIGGNGRCCCRVVFVLICPTPFCDRYQTKSLDGVRESHTKIRKLPQLIRRWFVTVRHRRRRFGVWPSTEGRNSMKRPATAGFRSRRFVGAAVRYLVLDGRFRPFDVVVMGEMMTVARRIKMICRLIGFSFVICRLIGFSSKMISWMLKAMDFDGRFTVLNRDKIKENNSGSLSMEGIISELSQLRRLEKRVSQPA